MSWKIDRIIVGPIQCNCYILWDSISRKAYVVDPGAESQELLWYLKKMNLDLQAVLITHAHIDHVGGVQMVHDHYPAPVYFHEGDRFLYENLAMQAAMFGARPDDLEARQPLVGEGSLKDKGKLEMPGGEILVIHTPGHTPGSVCFHVAGDTAVVFTGDTLFEGSIGRTDLWGGSFEEILRSIKGRLMALEDSVRVLPGHGPFTTIGEERRSNPFILQY